MEFDELKTQGTKVQYYLVCPRKLWLYSKQITMEHTSDRVLQGKILHEQSYLKSKKELNIDNLIHIDLIDGETIGEVKSSSKMVNVDRMQLLYYLYYLKQCGINRTGKIHYVKEKRVERVNLTSEDEKEVIEVLEGIKKVNEQPVPPKANKVKYCTKCAYYSFCFSGEYE
jgi:CRISPR-associated exonuclease Cas4